MNIWDGIFYCYSELGAEFNNYSNSKVKTYIIYVHQQVFTKRVCTKIDWEMLNVALPNLFWWGLTKIMWGLTKFSWSLIKISWGLTNFLCYNLIPFSHRNIHAFMNLVSIVKSLFTVQGCIGHFFGGGGSFFTTV